MTQSVPGIVWLVAAVVLIIGLIYVLSHRRKAEFDRGTIGEETRQAARDAVERAAQEVAPRVVQDASDAAVRAYREQQEAMQQAQAEKRREATARAKETKARKIASLQSWRPTFVQFVRRLAEPFFTEWQLGQAQLDEWAEARADVYIQKKPYVLEIIQSVHADAQRAAEQLAQQGQKSPREIARSRVKSLANTLKRNTTCPYCGVALDGTAHLDHIVPVQHGGPSEAWNMVYCCVPCNRAKRDLSLMELIDSDYARRKHLKAGEIAKRLQELHKYVEVAR